MKHEISVPGPARVMYRTYLCLLVVVIYSGFNYIHPFASGWTYPWSNTLIRMLNLYTIWAIGLLALVYLYYATLGRPAGWIEPLGAFRVILALYTIWFFVVSQAISTPYGLLKGFADLFGGASVVFRWYRVFLWTYVLLSLIYIYSRWACSERFPSLSARPRGGGAAK